MAVSNIRISQADFDLLSDVAFVCEIEDSRMRKTTTPRGCVAGIIRALAAKEREAPGTLRRVLGK